MESISIEEVLRITEGEWLQGERDLEIKNVKIDSRKIDSGDLYIPIIGEKNNGHVYIEQAFLNGARVSLTQEKDRLFPAEMTVIFVSSTLAALKALASFNRHRYQLPVIAITGSSGKTTTKDLVAAVLSQKYHTLKTAGNFNNEYGIPQTLFNLGPEHEMAVIEMGMDHLGDIAKSISSVDPDIGVITNIGLCHIERLKTQENIFEAKKEILQTLTEEGIALVNGDDPFLKTLKEEKHRYRVQTFGIRNAADIRVRAYESGSSGLKLQVEWQENKEHYTFAFPGEHNVYNCLVAIWLGHYYHMTPTEIQKGLDAFVPSGNRMNIFSIGAIRVINDTYNANPDAMKASLDVLEAVGAKYRRRIAVLGDMLEMGDYGPAAHYAIGEYASQKADILIGVGELGKEICRGYGQQPERVYHVPDAQAAGVCLRKIIAPEDIVLLKASRGMGLEKVIDYIEGGNR
jgi:UDP-N-acetylmuramoyl-tripeptide--D-alanyl-D-alanine ligase